MVNLGFILVEVLLVGSPHFILLIVESSVGLCNSWVKSVNLLGIFISLIVEGSDSLDWLGCIRRSGLGHESRVAHSISWLENVDLLWLHWLEIASLQESVTLKIMEFITFHCDILTKIFISVHTSGKELRIRDASDTLGTRTMAC